MNKITVKNITVTRGEAGLVNGANVSVGDGEFAVLLGPNGAGKTSLLRAALGLLPVDSGETFLNEKPIGAIDVTERAKMVSYLPQTRALAWPVSVRDVVALGRFAHGAPLGKLPERDAKAVDDAIAKCGLERFANRSTATLSGGELARVHFARAFAANTPLMVADEPVAALDPLHQHQVLRLMRGYVDNGGGVLCVLHDIGLAAQYADRLIWMMDGKIVADGSVDETLTSERMAEIYGVNAVIQKQSGKCTIHIDGPA